MKKLLATLILSTAAIVSAQQVPSVKAATTFDAASCFAIKGISKLEVKRDPRTDRLLLYTNIIFSNFTEKVLGGDRKQDIRIKDLQFSVSLVDNSVPYKTESYVNEKGELVNSKIVYKKTLIGRAAKEEFEIPKDGLYDIMGIAMDQVTKNGNKVEIDNEAFHKFMLFFNLMNGLPSERETSRIVFDGSCKVTVKGENQTWIWSDQPIKFEWYFKPYSNNEYVLEPAPSISK